jgi:HEAT repeat protein
LSSGVLEGLAQQPFSEVESVFLQLIEDPEASVDLKLEAIEALAEGIPETADFLLEMARSADDPELRSAAIDALALSGESADALADFGAMLLGESSENVRADIYNSLAFNADRVIEGSNTSELVSFALAETGSRPQLEGYRMVASLLHARYDTDLADTFDASMVTWLQDSAENGGDRYTRHLSIGALQLAGTPGALEALLDLSHSSDPTVSRSAETALSVAGKAGDLYAP